MCPRCTLRCTSVRIRLKFNPALVRPKLAPDDRRLWLFTVLAFQRQEEANPVWQFEVYWKRLALGAAVLAVVGYLCAATALHLWLDRVPQNRVTWPDVALAPVRWEHFRVKRGDTAIAVALERLKQKDYVEAYYGLRVGLSRSPGNTRGRVALAMLLNAGDPSQALRVLEEGLDHAPSDPDLLQALFALYRMQQAQTRALERTAELLSRKPPLPPSARRLVLAARATFLSDAGEFSAAEKILRESPASEDFQENAKLRLMRAEALVRLGRHGEARDLLAAPDMAVPPTMEHGRLLAEIAIAEGDMASLESALRRMKAVADDQPQAHIYAYQAWHRMKRPLLRDRAEQDFYRAFGGIDSALQLFAASAVNLEVPESVQRTLSVAVSNGLSPFAFRVHLTELALRRGDFDGALRLLGTWERQVDTLNPAQRFYPEFIERLTRASVAGGEAQIDSLAGRLSSQRGRVSVGVYRFAANVLERAGQPEGARRLLATGLRQYPWSDPLLEVDRSLAQRAQAPSGPSGHAATDPAAKALPATAEAALQQLDAWLAAGEYTQVRAMLRRLRDAPPEWPATSGAEISLREIRFALLTLDPLAARAALRIQLDRHPGADNALALVRLAHELWRAGKTDEARLLHDEVAARYGSDREVAEALAALALPDELSPLLASQETALAALDRFLAGRQPEEALRVFERLDQRPPPWRAEASAELAVREVRMRFALDQRPRALIAWKDLVLRPGPPREAAFRLVRELIRNGEQEQAKLLAREVAKLLPGDAEAGKLLQEAETPQPVD